MQAMCPSSLVFMVKELDPERWVKNGASHFTIALDEKDTPTADSPGGLGSEAQASGAALEARVAALEASLAAERKAHAETESGRIEALRDSKAQTAKADFQKAFAVELERQVGGFFG